MPTEAKRATVAELAEEFSSASASIVTDYRGLTVADLAAIRRTLRPQGITYRVVKNRLAKIAADQAGGPSSGRCSTARRRSPSAAATRPRSRGRCWTPSAPYRNMTVRGGVLGSQQIGTEDVTRLATLPGRDELLGQLAGASRRRMTTMAGLLAAPLRNLATPWRSCATSASGRRRGRLTAPRITRTPTRHERRARTHGT